MLSAANLILAENNIAFWMQIRVKHQHEIANFICCNYWGVKSLHAGKFFMIFLSSADFFQN